EDRPLLARLALERGLARRAFLALQPAARPVRLAVAARAFALRPVAGLALEAAAVETRTALGFVTFACGPACSLFTSRPNRVGVAPMPAALAVVVAMMIAARPLEAGLPPQQNGFWLLFLGQYRSSLVCGRDRFCYDLARGLIPG